jgi:hypothetical protein
LTPEQLSTLHDQFALDQHPEQNCSSFPYPQLPSHMPDTGVAEELGFSEEQEKQIRQRVSQHWMKLINIQQEEQNISPENDTEYKAIGERRKEEMIDLRKQIETILTPEQWASCKEMAFQNMAVTLIQASVHYPQKPSGAGIDLSLQQMADLQKIEEEFAGKPEQIYQELTDKTLEVFTPAQQEQLRSEVERRGW